MRQLMCFTRKEFTEIVRTGRLSVLLLIFVLFGIMNPAIAKLIPWMMSTFADSLAETGMIVTKVEVNALTSWTQFYKNMPMALMIFVLMFSSILTNEYQKGTLINIVTKGMPRWKVILSKAFTMILMWSVCYWLSYAITLGYNLYFWDNSMVPHMVFGPFCVWLLGVWVISLILFVSSIFSGNSAVLLGTGGIFLSVYLFSLFPSVKKYLPIQLLDAANLLSGTLTRSDCLSAVCITLFLSVGGIALAAACFNRKTL